MAKKICIRLDARKHICLVYGNGTKNNLCKVLKLKDYQAEDFRKKSGLKPLCTKNDADSFFVFNSPKTASNYIYNNNKLISFYNECINAVLSENEFANGKELIDYVITGNKAKRNTFTLIQYAEIVRDGYNTSNCLCYNKFINRLNKQASTAKKGQRIFANLDINTINESVWVDWCNYVEANNCGKDHYKCFRHVVYDYQSKINHNDAFKFNYSPKIKNGTATNNTISDEELRQLLYVDVDKIRMSKASCNTHEYKTMLKDIVALLYYSLTRHFDIILARVEDFYFENDRMYWRYHAHKTQNTTNPEKRDIPILYKEAYQIILKYIGERESGWLFPVFGNLNKNTHWSKLNSLRTHFNCNINEYLSKVAETYGFRNNPTCTTIRHTAITNLCAKGIISESIVAEIAQTSIKQLNRTYLNKKELAKKATLNIQLIQNVI